MAYGFYQNGFGNAPGAAMGNFQPQMMNVQNSPMGQTGNLFARYVTGREEAVAAQVIPDGNLNIFVDMNAGRIYTKAFGANGFSDFKEFAFVPPRAIGETQGVTMEMFMGLKSEVDAMRQMLEVKGND